MSEPLQCAEFLALAERHIAECSRNIVNQERVIALLENDGLDLSEARWLLLILRESLRIHEEDRDSAIRSMTGVMAHSKCI